MAGAGYKLFNTGDVLTAAQVNTYLMEQTVMVFADAAARTTALTGVVSEGMISYLKDTNAVEVYNGSAWVSSDDPNAIQNTIVDAKGDLITATASDVPARLAVGNNGDTLLADSASSTGLRWQSSFNGNAIINGAMDCWQRGTSFVGTGYNYTADRWMIFRGAFAAGMTASRQTSVPEGLQYALRIARDSGNTGTQALEVRYAMETADSLRFQNKIVTWSFWARAGANWSASTAFFGLYTGTGTDQATTNVQGGWTGSANPAGQSIALTTSWVRYSITGTIASTATQIGFVVNYAPTGTAGANDWIEFTGMQLELGSVATTWKRAGGTLQGELAACKYYYKRITGGSGTGSFTNFGTASSTTQVTTTYADTSPMRVTPTSIDAANVAVSDINNARINASSVTIDTTFSTSSTFVLNFAVSGATQYRPYTTLSQSGLTGYLGLSAEL